MAAYFPGKPSSQPVSWFDWALLSGIAFTAQIVEHAGSGAWITGFTTVVCFFISVVASLKNGAPFQLFDWLSQFGALARMLLARRKSF